MRSIEATKRAGRNYFLRNKEKPEFKSKRKVWMKKWRHANPDFLLKPSYRYAAMKAKAKQRKHELTISFSDYKALIEGRNCHYCGVSVFSSGSGLDRIDSSKGYIVGNCVPCCYRCNVMKADLSVEEFYEQVERILDFRTRRESRR